MEEDTPLYESFFNIVDASRDESHVVDSRQELLQVLDAEKIRLTLLSGNPRDHNVESHAISPQPVALHFKWRPGNDHKSHDIAVELEAFLDIRHLPRNMIETLDWKMLSSKIHRREYLRYVAVVFSWWAGVPLRRSPCACDTLRTSSEWFPEWIRHP